ncbi:glycoside hydrolase family 3 N-terminal domain-containing protein [Neolewinella agarilytica]|uniref:Beta-glucosidase n=1 Tax=Neolewinella agarilytica TaxID=478744 RepID=A0A1H9D864_9BACT|nr:glycoside hydrolase family 3 N-terminal domain-containing protein [Neolewinella agarilytica]SEQ09551.1 beta-glucosidase [Neolewinella agarilytica]
MKHYLPVLLLFFTLSACAQQPYQNAQLSIDERVADLLSKMTVEEKVMQMRIFHANKGIKIDDAGNLSLEGDTKERLRLGIAGIKNPGEHNDPVAAAKGNNALQKYIIENNRFGIPALFVTESYNGVDAEGCTKFGRPITSAASFNPELTHRQWLVVGNEARLRGMHMCHSPEADVVRDPRFGRMSEAFGEDTYLVKENVVAAITGVQGNYDGLGKGTHIGAVAKHFAGYGQVLGGTNFAAIEISERTLIDEIFPPFEAAVKEARTLGIMASHGDLNGVASHANPWLLTEVLRKQWGFKGYTVSDANDIGRLFYFMGVAETPEDAALLGLRAGMDVDLYADDAYSLLPGLAKKMPEIMTYIDRSAGHVLRTKMILGLFENPYIDVRETERRVRMTSSLALAREADEESIVLLKNDNKALPISKSTAKKIALLGPILRETSLEQFQKIAPGVEFVAEQGFRLTDEQRAVPKVNENTDAALDKLVGIARTADVNILFLGGDEHTAKEGFFNNALGDRASIDPVGPQDELLRRVKALGKPTIVVFTHRRTLSINGFDEHADAILDGWDLSEFGDEAMAKMIFGDANPSGKCPSTVPRHIGQLPFHYSGKRINNKKGYLFMENGPLYPFGHGLSYTSFDYSNARVSAPTLTVPGMITASVKVTNTGSMAGKEVVQLYLTDEIGSVTRPAKELKAFKKILLQPGETKTVSFKITPEMLAFTRLDMTKGVETGDYTILLGTSSAEGETVKFRLIAD